MEMRKKEKIIITAILSIAEALIFYLLKNSENINNSWVITFLSYITPMGFLCFINYYILSPILIYAGMGIWHLLGHYSYIAREFNKIALQCIVWLVDIDLHWGVIDTAEECQNANTCEGLLAIKKTGLEKRYSAIYYPVLQEVLTNVTNKGLASKSLKNETVVCTAMILYIYALEKESNINFCPQLETKFKCIAKNLWKVRGNRGWGVYIEKTKDSNCSIANTFWALRALNKYDIVKRKEYYTMIRKVYEGANSSLFGYAAGDHPRLCTTAMSVVLYFNLEKSMQDKISEVYDVGEAIEFVFKQFCVRGVECELEVLKGIEVKGGGVKRAPWTHVTIEFSIEALVCAYKNKKLSLMKMNFLINHIKRICKKQLIYLNGDQQKCYYIPKDMETRNDGIYTFPTAYFAWGLSTFKF